MAIPSSRTGNEIAIIGMAIRVPRAPNTRRFWENLSTGVESLQALSDEELAAAGVSDKLIRHPDYVKAAMTLERYDEFDPGFFGLSARDAAIMDPQHRHFLECVWEVFEDSGHDPARFDGAVGVFAGSGHNTYLPYNLLSNSKLLEEVGYFLLRHTANDKDFLATGASYRFDLRGPSVNVQTACSTSLVAVHLASNSLLGHECDLAIAGGVTIAVPHGHGHLFREQEILSSDGHCRPFDERSTGTVFGSGCGVVALRRLEDALSDGDPIRAVILGSAVNNDGANKVSYLAPSVDGQVAVMSEALHMAGVDVDSIDYIECHGTGTRMGDAIEIAALKEAYGHRSNEIPCRIGSVKSNVGHLDTAAGVASVIKVALGMEHRQLPPTLHFEAPNPELELEESPFAVVDRLTDWGADPVRASVNSLGVGGTNAHVVLESAPDLEEPAADREVQVFPLSARSPAALSAQAKQLRDHLDESPAPLPDIAWTLQAGRRHFPVRVAVAARTIEGVRDELERTQSAGPGGRTLAEPRVAMMFSGGGASHAGMGRGLYDTEPAYRSVLDQCCEVASAWLDYDLRSLLLGSTNAKKEDIQRPTRGLPSLFVTQYACTRLWQSMGIEPTALIGHSVGEYTAACVAGIMSVDDALRMVIRRAELFEELPAGAMLNVIGPDAELGAHLPVGVSVAVKNAPDVSVVSGPITEIESLAEHLPALGFEVQSVPIRVAAHSSMLDPILPAFADALQSVDFAAPRVPIASNLTGQWLTDNEASDPEYWVRQLRETVCFSDGLATVSESANVFLESGPGTVLSSLVGLQPFFGEDRRVVSSMRHPKNVSTDDRVTFYQAFGDLWTVGIEVDWSAIHDAGPRRRVSLPTYPFEHSRYWIDARPQLNSGPDRLPVDEWCHHPVWEPLPEAPDASEDAYHLMFVAEEGTLPTLDGVRVDDRVASARFVSSSALSAGLTSSAFADGTILVSTVDNGDSGPAAFERATQDLHEQAIAVRDSGATLSGWCILVRGAAWLPGDDAELSAVSAGIVAATNVIDAEIDVRVRCIDVTDQVDGGRLLDSLVEEDRQPLALRPSTRYVLRHRPAEIPLATDSTDGTEGCCVITGGLGDLALEFAQVLAASGWTRFALISRRGLPEPEEVAFFESEGGRMAGRMRSIDELREQGAAVRVWKADVADAAAMASVIDGVEEEMGPIGLVIHTAGRLDDGLLGSKTPNEIRDVLEPKSAARWLVENVDAPIVLFSSTSTVAGLPGQFAYAGANGYLDGLAMEARGRGKPVLSIGWGAWKETGMAARLFGKKGPRSSGPRAGSRRREGVLERIVHGDEWVIADHKTRSGATLMPGTGLLSLLVDGVGPGPVRLTDVSLLQPLVLMDEDRRVVQVRREGDRIILRSAEDVEAAESEEWLAEHAEAYAVDELDSAATLDLASIRQRCTIVEECPDRHPVHPHMDFGVRWNCLKRVCYGEGEALIEASLSSDFVDDLSEWRLHPALLDVASGAAQKLLPELDPELDTFVPHGYREVRAHGPLARAVVGHVRLAQVTVDTCDLDITIANAEGEVIVEINGFRLRRVRASVLDDLAAAPAMRVEAEPEDPLEEGIRLLEGLPMLLPLVRRVRSGAILVSPLTVDELRRRSTALSGTQDALPPGMERSPRPSLETEYVEPGSDLEKAIASAWQESLGFDSIGIEDNFFALGGHSLLLTKLVSRLRREVGLMTPLSDLFETPTVAHWANFEGASDRNESPTLPITRVSRDAYAVPE